MNLTSPVKLKNNDITFETYCNRLRNSQNSFIHRLNSQDVSFDFSNVVNLKRKANEQGELISYYGDTAVMRLDKSEIDLVTLVQDKLHENLSSILSERLDPNTFHITIHNFNNGNNKELLSDKIQGTQTQCKKIFQELADYFKEYPDHANAEVIPTIVYPGGVSVVMGFMPASDKDFRIIMNMHNVLDKIIVDNWPEPHITLAYFKPCEFSKDEVTRLRNILISFSHFDFSVKFNFWNLLYQQFENMKIYHDIFSIASFKD
jgi:hypothetical protein